MITHQSKRKIGQRMSKWIKNSEVIYIKKNSFIHFKQYCFYTENILLFLSFNFWKPSPPSTPMNPFDRILHLQTLPSQFRIHGGRRGGRVKIKNSFLIIIKSNFFFQIWQVKNLFFLAENIANSSCIWHILTYLSNSKFWAM